MDVNTASVKELKAVLDGAGVSYVGVLEKSELRRRAQVVLDTQASMAALKAKLAGIAAAKVGLLTSVTLVIPLAALHSFRCV